MRTQPENRPGRTLQRLWGQNQGFLLPFGFGILTGLLILAIFTKEDVHLAIDAHHCRDGDMFFSLVTSLGDGWAAVALVLILLFVRYRDAILMATVNIVSALIIQLLKHGPFAGSLRPWEYFRGTNALHVVPGIDMYSFNSFPSGHAATACASCFCLSLMTPHRGMKATLAIAGLVIAFSRVYLSQHFLADVCAGALLGILVGLMLAAILERLSLNTKNRWMELSLLRRSGRPGA